MSEENISCSLKKVHLYLGSGVSVLPYAIKTGWNLKNSQSSRRGSKVFLKRRRIICHIPGNVLLKENDLVPTGSDINLEIYLYFIKSNKLLLIDHKMPG